MNASNYSCDDAEDYWMGDEKIGRKHRPLFSIFKIKSPPHSILPHPLKKEKRLDHVYMLKETQ